MRRTLSPAVNDEASHIMSSIEMYFGCHSGASASCDSASEKNKRARRDGNTIVSDDISRP